MGFVTEPGCFSGVHRETGPWAAARGVLGSDLGWGWRRKGEVIDYTSIPSDAPVPQRYLCYHGNGEGQRNCRCMVGRWVPAVGRGEEGGGLMAFQPCRGLD